MKIKDSELNGNKGRETHLYFTFLPHIM